MNAKTAKFAYIWEYEVRDERLLEFSQIYGPQGQWVQLFSQSSGYVRTELHRDIDKPNRFLTIDYWLSQAVRDQFREQYASEFVALDERCEALTVAERFVGDFELAEGGQENAS